MMGGLFRHALGAQMQATLKTTAFGAAAQKWTYLY